MRLTEAFQCNLESDQVPHTEQWGDRQLCELRVDAEQAREVLLERLGQFSFRSSDPSEGRHQPGAPTPDNVINVLMDYDYGPDFRYNDQSGVMTNVVPPIRQIIPTLAVKIDEDGNEIAGLRSVLVQAPLGTYTGWNPVASGALRGKLNFIDAGYIPFVVTKAERTAAGDPRPSVEERYGSQEGYNCLVRHAAKNEVRKRFLLPEDADRLIAEAAAAKVLPSDPDNRIAKRLCKEIDRDDDHHGGRDHGNRGHDRHHRHGEY